MTAISNISQQRPFRRLFAVSAMTLFGFLTACGSQVAESSASSPLVTDNATADSELPLTQVFEDELGPTNLTDLVEASSAIIEARLVDVRPAVRFYGPDLEAPDALAFEQVALVFEPTEVYKGEVGEQIEIRWTAYVTDGIGANARRLERVEINGISVNENAKGQRYGLFVGESVGDQIFDPTISAGIVPINPAGRIQGRHSSSQFLYGDFIGGSFADLIASVDN